MTCEVVTGAELRLIHQQEPYLPCGLHAPTAPSPSSAPPMLCQGLTSLLCRSVSGAPPDARHPVWCVPAPMKKEKGVYS